MCSNLVIYKSRKLYRAVPFPIVMPRFFDRTIRYLFEY